MTPPRMTPFSESLRSKPLPSETVLGVLPGVCPSSRTVVLMVSSLCGHSSLRLQTESFSDDMGWFPQGSVELSATQLDALRPLMGLAASKMDPPRPTRVTQDWDDSMPATIPLRQPA